MVDSPVAVAGRRLGRGLQDFSHLFLSPGSRPLEGGGPRPARQVTPSAQGASAVPVVCIVGDRCVRGRASLTLSLARDLARQGRRVLLLDADYAHPRLWMSTDFPHESLLGAISASGEGPPAGEGTEGVRLLTLDVDLSSLDDIGAVQRASLATWFGSAEEEAHVILVSASSSLSRQMRAVLRASATIVVVTPTSADEIVHVYGAIKRLTRINPEARVGIVAGGGTCDRPQAPVGKLQRVVRRFLDRRLHDFGYLATPGSGAIVSRHLQARSLDARGPTLTQRLFGPL